MPYKSLAALQEGGASMTHKHKWIHGMAIIMTDKIMKMADGSTSDMGRAHVQICEGCRQVRRDPRYYNGGAA